MQKKHLHLFLLLLLVTGCSHPHWGDDNAYLLNKNSINIEYTRDTPAILIYKGADVRAGGLTAPVFRMRVEPFHSGFWGLQWGSAAGDPLAMPRRRISRSLFQLALNDSIAGYRETIIPLPDGRGAAFCLDSKINARYTFILTAGTSDSLLSRAPKRLNERTVVFMGADSLRLVVTASVKIDSAYRLSAPEQSPEWTFRFAETRHAQVHLAFCANEDDARNAMELSRRKPEQLEREVFADFTERSGFALRTDDDRTNRMFACLAAALTGFQARVSASTRGEIETAANLAPSLFLASREPSSVVFPFAGNPPRENFSVQETRDHLRWGGQAYRAALRWGMAGDDTLRKLSLDILTGLSTLQKDYVTSDLEVVADETITDSLMRLATAHIRLADLWTLGEEICDARGDHLAQGEFRKEASRAYRKARRVFNESVRLYRNERSREPGELETILDTTIADDEDDDESPRYVSYPDTALLLQAGAKFGFNWLDDRPILFWNPRLGVDGFVRQRFAAYRFRSDLQITETTDFDSLTNQVLEGSLPGFLSADPTRSSEPSLPAMAAAFQNLAEIYLGIQPNAFRHRVTIEPRVPSIWGRTRARIPFSSGYLLLDYDFANNNAIVGMTGIEQQIDIFFGFPLPDGGFIRTQFALVPDSHPMQIKIERDKKRRVHIRTDEVP